MQACVEGGVAAFDICAALGCNGGVWNSLGDTCADASMDSEGLDCGPIGACTTAGGCSLTSETYCQGLGGTYLGAGSACPTATSTATQTATPTATSTSTPTPTTTSTATPTHTGIPQGGECGTDAQCASGFCADGVCCDAPCTDPLSRCNLPGQAGTCASTAAPAPPMTPRGLLIALTVLGAVAAFTLRRRARRPSAQVST